MKRLAIMVVLALALAGARPRHAYAAWVKHYMKGKPHDLGRA